MNSQKSPAYLTSAEAAKKLGVTRRSIARAVAEFRLPALHIGRTIRIEARAIDPSAPEVWPSADTITTRELADLWRVCIRVVHRLVKSGLLAGQLVGKAATGQQWTYTFRRAAIARYVAQHSTGEDGGVVLMRMAS